VDKLSLFSIIFVSYPEALLIVLITLAAAGCKEVLNFRESKNLIRLTLTTLANVIMTVAFRAVLPYFTYTALVTYSLSFFIIVIVYRYKPLSCFLGFLLGVLTVMAGDVIVYVGILNFLGVSFETIHASDFLRLVASLGGRVLQLSALFVIIKVKNFNLQYVRLKSDEWIQIVLFMLMVLSSAYTIENALRILHTDFGAILNLLINTLILVIFSAWMVVKIFKIRKRTAINKKVHDFELNRIKKLLEQGQTDHVIELIDLALGIKRGGE
jgi:hypothetical protein